MSDIGLYIAVGMGEVAVLLIAAFAVHAWNEYRSSKPRVPFNEKLKIVVTNEGLTRVWVDGVCVGTPHHLEFQMDADTDSPSGAATVLITGERRAAYEMLRRVPFLHVTPVFRQDPARRRARARAAAQRAGR